MRRDVEFNSKGDKCRGWLITPDDHDGPFPIVIMAGGWCYVKEIVMPNYAERFVREGFATLLFDYRGFGASDGALRQHVDPWAQIEDYRNAITFVERLPEIDPERIAIWGISYSGGHVLIVGALDPRVKCIASTIPVVDGNLNMRLAHGERRYLELQEAILADRRAMAEDPSNRRFIPMSGPRDGELVVWPYPDVRDAFLVHKNTVAPRHEHWNTLESVELLCTYTVFPYVGRIVNTPTIMVVAEGDDITIWDLEIEAFNKIKSPRKRLFGIPKTTHMTLYKDMSRVEIVAGEQAAFLAENLIRPYE